jgi:hypothetical protein
MAEPAGPKPPELPRQEDGSRALQTGAPTSSGSDGAVPPSAAPAPTPPQDAPPSPTEEKKGDAAPAPATDGKKEEEKESGEKKEKKPELSHEIPPWAPTFDRIKEITALSANGTKGPENTKELETTFLGAYERIKEKCENITKRIGELNKIENPTVDDAKEVQELRSQWNKIQGLLVAAIPFSEERIDYTKPDSLKSAITSIFGGNLEDLSTRLNVKEAAENATKALDDAKKIDPADKQAVEEATRKLEEAQKQTNTIKDLESFLMMRILLDLKDQQNLSGIEAKIKEGVIAKRAAELKEREDCIAQMAAQGLGAYQKFIDAISSGKEITKDKEYKDFLKNCIPLPGSGGGARATLGSNGQACVVFTSYNKKSFAATAKFFKRHISYSNIPKKHHKEAELACLREGKHCSFDGKEHFLSQTMPRTSPPIESGHYAKWINNIQTMSPEPKLGLLDTARMSMSLAKDSVLTKLHLRKNSSAEAIHEKYAKKSETIQHAAREQALKTVLKDVIGNDKDKLIALWADLCNQNPSPGELRPSKPAFHDHEQVMALLSSEQRKIIQEEVNSQLLKVKQEADKAGLTVDEFLKLSAGQEKELAKPSPTAEKGHEDSTKPSPESTTNDPTPPSPTGDNTPRPLAVGGDPTGNGPGTPKPGTPEGVATGPAGTTSTASGSPTTASTTAAGTAPIAGASTIGQASPSGPSATGMAQPSGSSIPGQTGLAVGTGPAGTSASTLLADGPAKTGIAAGDDHLGLGDVLKATKATVAPPPPSPKKIETPAREIETPAKASANFFKAAQMFYPTLINVAHALTTEPKGWFKISNHWGWTPSGAKDTLETAKNDFASILYKAAETRTREEITHANEKDAPGHGFGLMGYIGSFALRVNKACEELLGRHGKDKEENNPLAIRDKEQLIGVVDRLHELGKGALNDKRENLPAMNEDHSDSVSLAINAISAHQKKTKSELKGEATEPPTTASEKHTVAAPHA